MTIMYRVICAQCGQLAYAAFDIEGAQFECEWHAFHYGSTHTAIVAIATGRDNYSARINKGECF